MITSSTIALGDRLGAQLNKLAILYFFADKFNQKIVFYPELQNFGRTYQFLKYFDIPVTLLKQRLKNTEIQSYFENTKIEAERSNYYSTLSEKDYNYLTAVQKTYSDFSLIGNAKNSIHYDFSAINFEKDKNYDIISGFGTYQDWKTVENKICSDFKFKKEILNSAANKYKQIQTNTNKETVAVHFRRGDYLSLASLNLKRSYYKKALHFFSPKHYQLVIFSDDINYCKNIKIFSKYAVNYAIGNNPGEDMCLMSLCSHNIIANSTFSFWAAMLNKNPNKKVLCPEKFMGKKDKEHTYINGNYYPKTWIAIKINEFYLKDYIIKFINPLYKIKYKIRETVCQSKK